MKYMGMEIAVSESVPYNSITIGPLVPSNFWSLSEAEQNQWYADHAKEFGILTDLAAEWVKE